MKLIFKQKEVYRKKSKLLFVFCIRIQGGINLKGEKVLNKALDYAYIKKLLKLKLISEKEYKLIKEKIDNYYIQLQNLFIRGIIILRTYYVT